MSDLEELEQLKQRFKQEQQSRQDAERLLEEKNNFLTEAHRKLKHLSEINEQTREDSANQELSGIKRAPAQLETGPLCPLGKFQYYHSYLFPFLFL